MSVKMLRKQLLAAIAMTIVAIIAVTGSTFAWFATNTRVSASQMSVTATSADPFLHIKRSTDADTEYTTVLTFNSTDDPDVTLTDLKLVAPTTIGATPTWYTALSGNPDQAVDALSATTQTTVTDGDSEYMIKKGLTIKNSSTVNAENLEASATITIGTGTNIKMNAAARVLIVTETGAYALFNSDGTLITSAPATASNAILTTTLTAGSTLGINVYVYFDGTDTTAKNTTGLGTDPVTVDLKFTIKGDPDNSTTV